MPRRNNRKAERAASRRNETAVTLFVFGVVLVAAPWFVEKPPLAGALATARPFGFLMLLGGGVLLALGRLLSKAPAPRYCIGLGEGGRSCG